MDAKSKLKKTPLHLATAVGNAGMASLLISKSANVNAMDTQGRTPLDLAESAFIGVVDFHKATGQSSPQTRR